MQELEEYKGFKINVDEEGVFHAKSEDAEFQDEKLADLKKKVDKLNRTHRTPCYLLSRWGGDEDKYFFKAEITSIAAGDYGNEVWVFWKKDGKPCREKRSLDSCYKPTTTNEEILKERVKLDEEIQSLHTKKRKLEETFEKFSPKDFGYGL